MIASAPNSLSCKAPPCQLPGALAAFGAGVPGPARSTPGSKTVDIFLSLLAGMMACKEVPKESDESQPAANAPAAPADSTVVSPLLVRFPRQQQAPLPAPPLARSPGEWPRQAQNDAAQPLRVDIVGAARHILNSPPEVQPLVFVPEQRAEDASAVRVIEVEGACPASRRGVPGPAPSMPGSKTVDMVLAPTAELIAREELPQERDKSQPSAKRSAAPVDGTVISSLPVRCPQQQPALFAPPVVHSPVEPPGRPQNDVGPLLPANILCAVRDILNRPPAVQPFVQAPGQRGEVTFAVRVVEVKPEAAPAACPPDDAASLPVRAAIFRPETIVNGECRGDAASPEPSPSRAPVSSVGQSRYLHKLVLPALSQAVPVVAQTAGKAPTPGEGDVQPTAPAGEASAPAAVPGDHSLPRSAMMPQRAQHTEASVPLTPPRAEVASPHSQTAKEITVRLAADDSPAVDIRVIDRAGAVRIAVRTADTHLARSMQAGLGDLVNGLEHKGFTAEVWSPASSCSGTRDADTGAHRQHFEQGNGAFEQSSGGQHHRHGQGENGKPDGRHRPQWVSELASSIGQQEKEYRT